MQWWQYALLGAAGGVIIEALEIFHGMTQWQQARRDRHGRLKRLPAKLGRFVDFPAHARMLPARCQRPSGNPVGRSCLLRADGHQFWLFRESCGPVTLGAA